MSAKSIPTPAPSSPGNGADTESIVSIALDAILPNPHQPRRQFRDEQIASLAASIEYQGVLLPLIVRRHPRLADRFELVAGERRLRALKHLGKTTTPAVLRNVSDDALLEMALVENLQREPLTPIEEAQAYRSLMDAHGYTQEKLAARVGKDRSTIANMVRLLGLPESIQEDLESGRLSVGHARSLLGCSDPAQMVILRNIIVERDLSVRESERLLRTSQVRQNQALHPTTREKPANGVDRRTAIEFETVRDEMERVLGTRVTILPRGEGGKLEIEYFSIDDFNRIYDLLLNR